MATPYFIADAANVTILRPLASSAFGSYSLSLPEGIELEDVHNFDAPGNELGHVSMLHSSRRVGGLARRFVRADVNVTAADPSGPDVFPESDVDQVLTEARERVSGDFFLESDITKAGLGPWVPFEDFQVGDLARVEIWGQVVILPITRIEPVISDHDVVDWTVHVGGQLVSDEDARLAENQTLHKAFVQDRRELADVEWTANRAAKTADGAAETAGTIDDDLDRAAETVTGELDLPAPDKDQRLELSLGQTLAQAVEANATAVGLAFPQESIVPAAANGHPYWAWSADSSDGVPDGYDAPADAGERSYRPGPGSSADLDSAYVRLSDKIDYKVSMWLMGEAGSRAAFTLLDEDGQQCIERWQRWSPEVGEWVAGERVMLFPDQTGSNSWGRYEYAVREKPGTRWARVVVEGGGSAGTPWVNRLDMAVLNRPQEEIDRFQSEQIEQNQEITERLEATVARLGRLQNLVIGNTHSNIDYEIQSTAVPPNVFPVLYTFTTALDITYNIYYRIGWDAASMDDYSLSIAVNGVERYWHRVNNLGPLFPWENGYRTMQMTRNGVSLRAGDTISFRVWSNAPNTSQRRVRDGVINMSQVL